MIQQLTQQQLKKKFEYDPETGLFYRKEKVTNSAIIGSIAGFTDERGYVRIKIGSSIYAAGRLAYLYMTGEFPENMVDHINGIKDDNKWCNLREATNSENLQNQTIALPFNKTGLLGVSKYGNTNKYTAQIYLNGKKKHLGYFDCKYKAHQAYLDAKRELHTHCTI
jgi:hypothetical protein